MTTEFNLAERLREEAALLRKLQPIGNSETANLLEEAAMDWEESRKEIERLTKELAKYQAVVDAAKMASVSHYTNYLMEGVSECACSICRTVSALEEADK